MRNILITKIEDQKRNKDRVSVYIDDQFAFGIEKEIAIRYNVNEGISITKDFIDDVLFMEEEKKSFNYALRLLSYKQRSEKELFDKMVTKGFDPSVISKSIERMKELDLIDDKNYAKSLVLDRINFRKWGIKLIQLDLLKKGISKAIIEEVIENHSDAIDEYQIAYDLAKKKVASYKKYDTKNKSQKLSMFLGRKGYNYDIISKVVREVVNELKEE